jgi:hypothetical protein
MTKRTTFFVLTAAFLAAVSSSDLSAADLPQQIGVIVKATDSGLPADRFLVVDPAKDDVVKEVKKALRKSSDLLVVTDQQPGDSIPVTIVLGVSNVCVSTGAELHPKQPELARQLIWVIDTDDAVITNRGAATKPAHHVRSFRGAGPDRAIAIDMVAKDLIAWIAANRSALLAGK